MRDHINVLSGLSHLQADTFGDGTGDHPRASAAWLTGVHAYDRTQPGVEVRLATTADQIAAQQIGKDTQVPSLELSVDFPTQGACDSGDCFYVNTVSWRNETTPNPDRIASAHRLRTAVRRRRQPRRAAGARRRAPAAFSIRSPQEVESAVRTLGAGDRAKLSEYLDSVREIEQRIQNAESQRRAVGRTAGSSRSTSRNVRRAHQADVRSAGAGIPGRHHARLQHDHGARAQPADFPQIGVPEQHHAVRITGTIRS